MTISPLTSSSYPLHFAKRLSRVRGVVMLLLFASIATTMSAQDGVTQSTLYSFTGAGGYFSTSGLVQGSDGNFYGTAADSSSGFGTIFKITPGGDYTVLYTFTGGNDGAGPQASLIQGGDGNFYGTAATGGSTGYGTIFKVSPNGNFTLLYTFKGGTDGGYPIAGVIQASDGNFYGMTAMQNTAAFGSIYKITPGGKFTLLYTFTGGSDGGNPFSTLVQGIDGNFYGTTAKGGVNNNGTVFQVTPNGVVTTLYLFTGASTDGYDPETALVQNNDGDFYGAASDTSTGESGTIFKISPTGDFSVVYSLSNSSNQSVPNSLFIGSDGNFYGASEVGGAHLDGSVFLLTPSKFFNALYSFSPMNEGGYNPLAGLVQATDGNFYGTTQRGGANSDGVIYELAFAPALPAPVQLSLNKSSITVGSSVTLSYSVLNAFSATMEQCYGFQTLNGVTTALGKVPAIYNSTTLIYSGSVTLSPAAGTYTYALTCGGQETGLVNLTVLKNSSATSMSTSPNPASIGQRVTLTATVTKSTGAAAPTGTVNFSYGSLHIGSGSVNSSGVATYTASTNGLPAGKYGVTASYSGDSNYGSSQSTTYDVSLAQAPTATALSASPTSVTPPGKVTLTAVVTRSAAGAVGNPTGSVTFYYGARSLGSASLNSNGVATLTASSNGIPPGDYGLTAKYKGDSADIASTSNTVVVIVQ